MIPEGWQETTLGHLTKIVTSGSRDWAQHYSKTGAKFIRMTNLARDGIYLSLDKLKFVNVKNDSSDGKRTQLKNGDILISITAELGKIAWIPENIGEAYINQHTALVRLNKKHSESKFIAYLLSSRSMNNTINRLNDAGAKAGLNLPTIKSIPINLPPLPEQIKIANILTTWDKAVETVEKLIDNSRAQKQALMRQLLTGTKRLPGFSEEWYSVVIQKMGRVVSGGTPDTNIDSYWDEDFSWATPTDITALKSRFIEKTRRKISLAGVNNSSAHLLPEGSILVCTRATIGHLAIAKNEITTNQGFKSLTPSSKYDSDFIYYLFKYHKHIFIRYACGSTFLEISKKDFSKLSFTIPGLKEQKEIARRLNSEDDAIRQFEVYRDYLVTEKKALMQQLLSGKRRVKIDTAA